MDAARQTMMDPKHTFQEASPRGSGVCWKCGQPESAHWSPPPGGAAYDRGAAEAYAACAAIVRRAGCLCGELNGSLECMADWDDNGRLVTHDPRCPAALLAAIEARRHQ